MIKEIIQSWNENKWKLEEYFKLNKQSEYDEYKKIVEKIFELVINDNELPYFEKFNTKDMTIIDNGNYYQGTQIFILHKDTYQPEVSDYIMTDTYYGSCSGCDTLLGVSRYDDGIPTEEQVREYMTLSLHLVQKLRWLPTENGCFNI